MSGFREREAARNNFRNAIVQQATDKADKLQAANAELTSELNELRGKVRELQVENNDLRSVVKMLEADIKAFRTEYPAPITVLGVQVTPEVANS